MSEELTPPDRERCQALIRAAHGPFVLGPKPRHEQCKVLPSVIVTEKEPGEDGKRGSMSLCISCLNELLDQVQRGKAAAVNVEKV